MTRHALHYQISCSCGAIVVACGCKIVPAGSPCTIETRENGCENCQTIEKDRQAKIARQTFAIDLNGK